jgi:hypothetical protein
MVSGSQTAVPPPRPERDERAWTVDIMLALVGLTLLAHLLRLLARHTFWYDEAMLLNNIADGTLGDLFGPLPFYDQAAPQLYLLLLKALHSVFGVNEIAWRLPSWLAGAAAIGITARAMPGVTALERAAAAAVLAGGITFAYLTTEAKQYTVEILCSCVMMAFLSHAGGSMRAHVARFGVLLIAMLSASTFPLAALAVGATVMLQGLRPAALQSPSNFVQTVVQRMQAGGWIFAAAGVIYVIYYALHIRGAYEALLRNFGYTYQGFGFVRDGSYPLWLIEKVWSIVESHYGVLAIAVIALALFGAVRIRGRALPYVTQAAVLFAAMVVLNRAGIYPLLPARFSMFMMPWLAVLAGIGIADLLTRIQDRGFQMMAAVAVTILILFPSAVYIANPNEHQARQSIDLLRGADRSSVMVTVSSQPVFDLYVQPRVPARVDRCRAPGVIGYTNRCRALKAAGDGITISSDTKWYLLNYAAIVGRGVEPVGFPGPDPQAFARTYVDWLVAQVPVNKPVLLFTAPQTLNDTDAGPLQARLKSIATVERARDERRTPNAARAGLVDRVQR